MSDFTREQFYEWLAKHEVKIIEKQNELDIRLKSFEKEVLELTRKSTDSDYLVREFEAYLYKSVLPKVGEIIDREKGHHEKLLEHIHEKIEDLDHNTVKKSNVSKYVGAILGVVFAGGLGSVWNSLYEMQTKLDSVPLLKTQVTTLTEQNRDTEKQLFVMQGNVDSVKETLVTIDEQILKISNNLASVEKSVDTNTFSISDVYSKITKITPKTSK